MPDPDRQTVFEAKLLVTVLGEDDSAARFRDDLTAMSLERLGREMDEGELIGLAQVIACDPVAPADVAARLMEVGNDGTFFDRDDDAEAEAPAPAAPRDPAGRILRAQIAQGWTVETMEMLARRFIDEAGLGHAYAAFLERTAEAENDAAIEGP